jgi:hypothetical protein
MFGFSPPGRDAMLDKLDALAEVYSLEPHAWIVIALDPASSMAKLLRRMPWDQAVNP